MLIGFSFLWKVSRDFLSSVANSKQCIKPFTKWVYRIIRAEREKRERIELHDFISISDVFTLFDFYFDPHTHTPTAAHLFQLTEFQCDFQCHFNQRSTNCQIFQRISLCSSNATETDLLLPLLYII